MAREFDRNMFIMLLSIMIGVILITYFIADIMRQSQIESLEEKHTEEIETIEKKNINFTGHLLDSLISLNLAKDFRMGGEINYQTAYTFYNIILSETNESRFNSYKTYILEYCDEAMSDLWNSYLNFNDSVGKFNDSRQYTTYDVYIGLIDLNIEFAESGARLARLRYNSSSYLINLTNLLTFEENKVNFSQNVSILLEQFNETLGLYDIEWGIYMDLREQIDLYELYKPLR